MARPCGNDECSVSSTIADTLSFGSGELDFNGIWEFPCRICAEAAEKRDREKGYTEYMPYHPYAESSS